MAQVHLAWYSNRAISGKPVCGDARAKADRQTTMLSGVTCRRCLAAPDKARRPFWEGVPSDWAAR